MTKIRLDGFPTGSAVAFSVASGTASASADVAEWAGSAAPPPPPPPPPGDDSDITMTLSATRLTGTAPAGILFEASATSPVSSVVIPYHDIHYTWDFGDAGEFQRMATDMPWGRDRNLAYGPVVSHTFGAGSYTVTCTARDGVSAPRVVTLQVVVADADAVFAGADTGVISHSGNFTGKPAGASEYTSFAAAKAAMSGRAQQRYLFRRGETFSNPDIRLTDSCDKVSFGAFGSGADPVIQITNLNDSGIIVNNSVAPDEVCVEGLDFRLPYDATNPGTVKPNGEGIMFGGAALTLSGVKTVHNCRIEGGAKAIWIGGKDTSPQYHVYVSDTWFSSWHDYGIFCGTGGYIGLAGITGAQPTGTINGAGQNSSPYYADQGPFRVGNQDGPVALNLIDMASFNSWAADSNNRSFQQCLRINSGQVNEKINIDRIRTEGGMIATSTNTSNDDEMAPIWCLADKWHHIHSDQQSTVVVVDRGGQTFRNIVAVVPNNIPGSSTGTRRFVADDTSESILWNADRRVEVYSYTFVDLRSDANARNRPGTTTNRNYDPGVLDAYSSRYMGNGIDHAPNMTSGGVTADAPLNSTGTWSPRYDGERWENQPLDTSRAYGVEVTADFAPLPGSDAIGDASGKVAIDDFYGVLRGGNPSRGAIEPS
ncbi:MAG: PKD domain-containing protein [Pseudomonadota bacterium]